MTIRCEGRVFRSVTGARRHRIIAAALCAVALGGCTSQPSPAQSDESVNGPVRRESSPDRPSVSNAVPVVDADGLKKRIADAKGKVVLLDFWATWCAPCVQALPELARLRRQFDAKDLEIIAVSFDDPAIWTKKAVPVLKRVGWDGPAVVMADRTAQDAIVEWLAIDWRSELPAKFILDRSGTRLHEVLADPSMPTPPIKDLIESALKN